MAEKCNGNISDLRKSSNPNNIKNVEKPTPSITSSEQGLIRNRLDEFQAQILKDIEQRTTSLIDEVMESIRQHELQVLEFRSFAQPSDCQHNSYMNRRSYRLENNVALKTSKSCRHKPQSPHKGIQTHHSSQHQVHLSCTVQRALPDKMFISRESYLTALLEIPHMKTIYHIFYVILLMFLMNSVFYDYFVEKRINFGISTFYKSFAKLHYVLAVWILQHVFLIVLYYSIKGWALVRVKLRSAPLRRFWSHSCIITYISSQLFFGYVATILCLKWNLPFVSACVLLLETTRLLMKQHAYIRTMVARILNMKTTKSESDDKRKTRISPIGHYVYFIFAPTLIYRDNYPRTSQIRWNFALARFLEVVAIAFMFAYIHERHIVVHFADYGQEQLNESSWIIKLFGMLMPSIVILLGGFYLILHSWLNFTSELLRFGDRMFYKDWWTASTYEAYYRNWNVVVHDWLYEYIYKDFYYYVFSGSKLAASLMVFLVSSIVHEYILGFALQLFFPVIFVFFGIIGVALVFITRKSPKALGNIFLWFSLIFGNGLMVSLYSLEYYSRLNCQKVYNNWMDYLTPALLSCYAT